MRALSLAVLAAPLLACGARGETQFAEQVEVLAREVAPGVERAVGLSFRYPPNVAVRSREQVHDYLVRKMATEFPREEVERIQQAYALFGLIPPDLDLEALLVDLYSEQVVGYYDPVLDTLFVVAGAEQVALRLIVAHELVHALQAQYVPLDSILSSRGDNDRRMAAQAVFEGQGVLASLLALMPGQDLDNVPDFWRQMRQSIRMEQERMPVFNSAPLILREGLIFPYLGGADFVRWFSREYPGEVPFGPRIPHSTEQILHPEKYRQADLPLDVEFTDSGGLHEDGLGEFEMRILLTQLTGSESTASATVRDWGGDRYRVYELDGDQVGHALVWWTVWDTPNASRRFATVLEREWTSPDPDGRAYRVIRREVAGRPAVALVDAPEGWWGLGNPPVVEVSGGR